MQNDLATAQGDETNVNAGLGDVACVSNLSALSAPITEPARRNGEIATKDRFWWLAAAVTMAAACIPAVVWIGDAPWNVDEPALISVALRADQSGVLATHGLRGNFNIPYGPLPLYTHQILLLITHDPHLMMLLRALICGAATAGSLLWIARSLRLTPWFAAAVVLAPCVWMFNRMLWDASLAIPVGALALAAYASFLRTRSATSLLLAIAGALSVLLIHLQTLPLAMALLGHLLWQHRPALRQHAVAIAALVGAFAGMNFIYVCIVVRGLIDHAGSMLLAGHPLQTSLLGSILGPLMGGTILSGREYVREYHLPSGRPALTSAFALMADVVIVLVWAGVAVALWRQALRWHNAWRVYRNVSDGMGSAEAIPDLAQVSAVRDTVYGIALAGLGMQMILHGLMKVPPYPQYFLGSFAFDMLLAWAAVEALAKVRLRVAVIGLYALGAAGLSLGTMWEVHRSGWIPELMFRMSPTLNEQIALARALNRYSDTSALTDVWNYKSAEYPKPYALWALRLLLPPDSKAPRIYSGHLVIRYRPDPTQPRGKTRRIELIEAASKADIPSGAEPVTLMPPVGAESDLLGP